MYLSIYICNLLIVYKYINKQDVYIDTLNRHPIYVNDTVFGRVMTRTMYNGSMEVLFKSVSL